MLCDMKMIPRPVLVLFVVLSVNCVYTLDECPGGDCSTTEETSNDGTESLQTPYIQEVTTYTAKPVQRPKVLSMLADDQMNFQAVTTTLAPTTAPKGRALDFAVGDHSNGLSNNTNLKEDLSDVSMDNDDEDNENFKTPLPPKNFKNNTLGICEKGGLTYENGEKLEVGCDSICTCTNGKMDCADRCVMPFIRKGKKFNDPFCMEKDTEDKCCSVLQCTGDTETEPLEICTYKNKTYNRGDLIQEGCLEVCNCEAGGHLSCKPRCAPITKTSEKCLEVPDMQDPCCKTVLCDVTLKDNKLIAAKYTNASTIKLEFDTKIEMNQTYPLIDISSDRTNWKTFTPLPEGYLSGLENTFKYAKIENTDDIVDIQNFEENKKFKDKAIKDKSIKSCEHKGNDYKIGEEFNDGCESFCVCKESGVKCLKLECPTYFGTDVLDPNCIEWETVPANFTPVAPKCCPEKLHCKNNGSCVYKGETYQNWQQIPSNITGCEKRCYCEMGNVECQNICPPVTALPPANLECLPQHATLNHLPGDDCCVYWMCNQKDDINSLGHPGLFGGGFTNYQQPHDDINVHILDALDAHTIRLAFTVPTVIVGLHGRVEVRYTNRDDDDPNSWELQVFAPPNDLIATPQLEFDLVDLKADTEYKIKITITLRDLHNTPTSRIYTIRTLKQIMSSTLPPMIPIEPNVIISDVNATWVNVAWRKFTEYELQFIDGVQLRFKEIDGKIYAATPLIHRAVTSYTLENLKPNAKYEIGIFFIPFPGQHTELHAEHMLYFTTANEIDTYGFNVTLEISLIKATNIEITWSGVPYPEDKYVNIYRAIYQSDSGKGDSSTFKVAKRDSPPKSTITDLKPGTRYRLWLEIYLTNGKIKTSNVQDFITKPRSAPNLGASTKQDKLSGELPEERGDYYGPLVIVAILAAIAILSTLVLLLILVRRHSQNKACITPPPRVSQSAYDNPTYKVEIQQETMDL